MRVLVQKFGGTSLATPELRARAADIVAQAHRQGYAVVVVVSAMGRKGEPYATDTLIQKLEEIGPGAEPRDVDLMLACGEIISSVVMAHTLRTMGLPAVAMTGFQAGIVTDDNFGNTGILEVRPVAVLRLLKQGKIVVVAGFQGATRSGDITTLGRGGSDTTAAALGAALKAESVDIYTDVDGVMTADPRIVEGARALTAMTYREVCEMAHLGAKVIHPRAVEIAMAAGVPLRIRSTTSDFEGTLVLDMDRSESGIAIKGDRLVTGLAHLKDMAQVQVTSEVDVNETGIALRVFKAVAEAGVSVDLINVFPNLISFIVREEVSRRAQNAIEHLGLESVRVRVTPGCAKVSIVGAGIRGVPGVMARMVEALHGAGIPILQTSDSHTAISCLVRQDQAEQALNALHAYFGLGNNDNHDGYNQADAEVHGCET